MNKQFLADLIDKANNFIHGSNAKILIKTF